MAVTRVAIAQFESSPTVEENRARLCGLVEEASHGGADLVLFHEIATTPYFCYDDEETGHFALAESVPGPSTNAVAEVASRVGTSVLLPIYEADGSARYNTVAYLEAGVGIVGKYRKTHIPVTGRDRGQKGADEGFYFAAGDTGFVVPPPVSGLSVGTMICYDRHFPEGGRAYALQGAHLIFAPTASYRGFFIEAMWKAELQTLAFQNSIYVAGVNKVGPVVGQGVDEGARYPGMSVIVSPEGRILAECGLGEEIAYADIDTDFCDQVRHGAMGLIHARRPEMYGIVTAPSAPASS